MDEIADEDLFLGFSVGKSGLFDTLFDRYDVSIYGYVKRSVLDGEIAQEITQSLWEKLIRKSADIADKIKDSDIDFRLKPYVFTMATNLINDHFRSTGTKVVSKSVSIDQSENPDEYMPVDDQATRTQHGLALDELGNCINRKLIRVSNKMRQTFEITRDGALTYTEAADVLGVSAESIRSRVKHVLKLIKPCLEEFRNG